MASRIEDYALIGDTQTAALVGKDGSIDWLCVPRFDSGAVFAALLGDREHGRWLLAPAGGISGIERRYRGDTLVLETTFETDDGVVRVVDCMPIRGKTVVEIVRIVEGVSGRVPIHMDLRIRFDYGSDMPGSSSPTARLARDRRARRDGPHHPGGDRGRRAVDGGRLRRRRRATRCPSCSRGTRRTSSRHATGDPAARCAAPSSGGASGRSRARTRASRRDGHAVADHAQGAHVRADGRIVAARHDVAAGVDRRACATGTTGTAGCATRCSRSSRS